MCNGQYSSYWLGEPHHKIIQIVKGLSTFWMFQTIVYVKHTVDTICKFILTSRMGHNVCMTSQIIRLLLRLVLLCRCCIILRYLFAPFYSYSSSFLTCLSCPFSFHTLFQNPFIYSRLNVSIHTIASMLQRKHIRDKY